MTGLPSRHSAGWPASSGPSSVHALASTHRHLPHFPHSTVSTTRPRATSRSRSTSFRRDAIPKPSFWHCARYTAKRFPSTARTVHLTLSPAFGGFIRARELHCSVFPDASQAARGTRAPQGAAARSLWEEKGAKRQRARGANGLPRPPPPPRLLVVRRRFATGRDSAASPPGRAPAGPITPTGAAQRGAGSAEGREAG